LRLISVSEYLESLKLLLDQMPRRLIGKLTMGSVGLGLSAGAKDFGLVSSMHSGIETVNKIEQYVRLANKERIWLIKKIAN
jgi:hypothetical protein